MSKKTLLILIIIIVFVGAIGFFALLNQNPIPRIERLETPSDGFVPFSQSGDFGAGEDGAGVSGNTPFTPPRVQTFFDVVADDSRLIQITESPVAGYTVFSKIVEIIEEPSGPEESIVDTFNFFEYPTLKIGDQGPGVQALQTVLNRVFPNETIPVDGNFTTDTKNAVIAFQTANNLGSDGVVGNMTKARLNQFQGLSTNSQDFEPIVRQEEYLTVRYQQRSNGFIFDYDVQTKEIASISDLVLAGVQESFFSPDGNHVVSRYLSGEFIETYVGTIEFLEGQYFLEGDFLAPNIPFVSMNQTSSTMVFFEIVNRRAVGRVMDLVSGNSRVVFNSPFTEWLPQFAGPNIFTLTTRAAAGIDGYSYVYEQDKIDVFKRGVAGLPGLTTNYNQDASKVIYSLGQNRNIETYVMDLENGSVTALGIRTLAEKCVWETRDVVICGVPRVIVGGEYPDDWYQGVVTFDDNLWRINTNTGIEEIISNLTDDSGNTPIDVINPILKNNILIFTNKKDLSLWMLDLR